MSDENESPPGGPKVDEPRRWWERPVVKELGVVALIAVGVMIRAKTEPPAPAPNPAPSGVAKAVAQAPPITGRVRLNPQSLPTAEAKRHLDLGNELFRRKEYDRAVEEFTAAIRLHPDDAEAHNHRGLAQDAIGRVDEAIVDFSAAVRLAPQKAGPLSHRGRVYARLERFAEAAADYTEALRLAPPEPEYRGRILYERARAHFLSRSYPAATADCTAMLRLIPGAAEAYLLRGQAVEAAGDPAAAIPDFREARRLDPEAYRAARAEWPTLPENP